MRWIGHVNKMDMERKVYNIFYNQPQGIQARGRPKNRRIDCILLDIKKCKIMNWMEHSRDRGIWRRSPMGAKTPTLGCSADEEEDTRT